MNTPKEGDKDGGEDVVASDVIWAYSPVSNAEYDKSFAEFAGKMVIKPEETFVLLSNVEVPVFDKRDAQIFALRATNFQLGTELKCVYELLQASGAKVPEPKSIKTDLGHVGWRRTNSKLLEDILNKISVIRSIEPTCDVHLTVNGSTVGVIKLRPDEEG